MGVMHILDPTWGGGNVWAYFIFFGGGKKYSHISLRYLLVTVFTELFPLSICNFVSFLSHL